MSSKKNYRHRYYEKKATDNSVNDNTKEIPDDIGLKKRVLNDTELLSEGTGDPVPEEEVDVEEYSRLIDEAYRQKEDDYLSSARDSSSASRRGDEGYGRSSSHSRGTYSTGSNGSSPYNRSNGPYTTPEDDDYYADDDGYEDFVDAEGYDEENYSNLPRNNGYGRNGYNRSNYSGSAKRGYNRENYNRENYNRENYSGSARNGNYNRRSYSRGSEDGYGNGDYNRNGYNRNGYNGSRNGGYNRGSQGYGRQNGNRGYSNNYYDEEPIKTNPTPLIIAVVIAALALFAVIVMIVSGLFRTGSNDNTLDANVTSEIPEVTEMDEPAIESEPEAEQTSEDVVVTESPSTEVVTTEAPTTVAPTTEAPATTEAPTTETPTTVAPTTEEPETEEPTTEEPITEEPVTEEPETEPAPKQVDISGTVMTFVDLPEPLSLVVAETNRIASAADNGRIKSMRSNRSLIYYDDDSNVIRIDISPGSEYGNTAYEEFYFQDNKLIFADYYTDNVEYSDVTRFYFTDGKVIGYSETMSTSVHYYEEGLLPADFAFSSGQPDLYSHAKAANSKMII